MKTHSLSRRILSSVISGAMLLSTAAMPASAYVVWNSGTLINIDFDNGVGLPWHTITTFPAQLNWDISDGTYNIEIVNNGGRDDGGADRWDCQFRHRNLTLHSGIKYHIHAEVTSDHDGEIFTGISDLSGSMDVWHNAMGATDDAKGYTGVEEIGQSWDCLPVKKDETLVIDAEFICERDIDVGEWRFMFGGAGEYQKVDCFPDGTKLKFDNMQLYTADTTPTNLTYSEREYRPYDIAVNQLGYFTDGKKTAVVHSDEPITVKSVWLHDEKTGKAIKEFPLDTTNWRTVDTDSGRYACTVDFSDFNEPGTYYLAMNNADNYRNSWSFQISDAPYSGVMKDAINYFYQNRCGMSIREEYITSKGRNDSAASLAHTQYVHDDTGYLQDDWSKIVSYYGMKVNEELGQIKAPTGWYESENHAKSVLNGAYAAWLLQNLYEFSMQSDKGKRFADEGGEVVTPENGNRTPDILDECRYELDYLLDMMVPEDLTGYQIQNHPLDYEETLNQLHDTREYAGMLFTAMQDSRYTYLGLHAWDYMDMKEFKGITRIVMPPSTPATLAGAAAFAQGARLFRDFDEEYADKLLNAAKTAYEAAVKNPNLQARESSVGCRTFTDAEFYDEFFWAASELYVTTGDKAYLLDLEQNPSMECAFAQNDTPAGNDDAVQSTGSALSFNHTNTAALGILTLLLHKDKLNAQTADQLTERLAKTADSFLEDEEKNAFGVPYLSQTVVTDKDGNETVQLYESDSNGIITNNAITLAYAYQLTNDDKYRDGAVRAMNYIFGCNPMDMSYVTSCGTYSVFEPTHRYWAHSIDDCFPYAPSGVLVSGPNSKMNDSIVKGLGMTNRNYAPQRCYVDSIEAWSVNSCGLDLNASLAWMMGFLSDAPEQSIIAAPQLAGDINGDNEVTVSDAILLARIIAEDTTVSVSAEGLENADVNMSGAPDQEDLTMILKKIAGIAE